MKDTTTPIILDAAQRDALINAFHAVNRRMIAEGAQREELFDAEGSLTPDGELLVFHSAHVSIGDGDIFFALKKQGLSVPYHAIADANDARQLVIANPDTIDTVLISNPAAYYFLLK
jgi:hypothetical protein